METARKGSGKIREGVGKYQNKQTQNEMNQKTASTQKLYKNASIHDNKREKTKQKICQLCYNLKAGKKKKKSQGFSPTCQQMSFNILKARITK